MEKPGLGARHSGSEHFGLADRYLPFHSLGLSRRLGVVSDPGLSSGFPLSTTPSLSCFSSRGRNQTQQRPSASCPPSQCAPIDPPGSKEDGRVQKTCQAAKPDHPPPNCAHRPEPGAHSLQCPALGSTQVAQAPPPAPSPGLTLGKKHLEQGRS